MTDRLDNNPFGELFTALKSYADLRVDEIKLTMAGHLARIISRLLCILAVFFLLFLALGFLCVCLSRWISAAAGCEWAGPLSIFGLLTVTALVLLHSRDKILLNRALRIFIEMFFGEEQNRDENR